MFQFDLAVFFDMRLAPHYISFAGIELNHVARPAESDHPINTVSVYRPSISNLTPLQLVRSFRTSNIKTHIDKTA